MTDRTASDGLDDLGAELDGVFRRELAERLAQMAKVLRTLDGEPGGAGHNDRLNDLARHAHSVKGGALLVGRTEIARLAGALEARFHAAQASRSTEPPPAAVRAALGAMARLGERERGSAPADAGSTSGEEIERVIEALDGASGS